MKGDVIPFTGRETPVAVEQSLDAGRRQVTIAEYVRLVDIKSAIPNTDEAYADADEESAEAYDSVNDAQMALLTTSPTTVAGAAAVLAYLAGFWIEGDDS